MITKMAFHQYVPKKERIEIFIEYIIEVEKRVREKNP